MERLLWLHLLRFPAPRRTRLPAHRPCIRSHTCPASVVTKIISSMSSTTIVHGAMMARSTYASVVIVKERVASTGLALVGQHGEDTSSKHPKMATHQTTSSRMYSLETGIADQPHHSQNRLSRHMYSEAKTIHRNAWKAASFATLARPLPMHATGNATIAMMAIGVFATTVSTRDGIAHTLSSPLLASSEKKPHPSATACHLHHLRPVKTPDSLHQTATPHPQHHP